MKQAILIIAFFLLAPRADTTATLWQHSGNRTCSGSTCVVNLDKTTRSGDVIVIGVSIFGGNATISSVSGGGTYTHSTCATNVNNGSLNSVDASYTLNSTSGALSITVTLSNGTNSGWAVHESEWVAGSPALDVCGSATTTTANPVGPTLTLSGSNDFIVQMLSLTTNQSAITGGAFVSPTLAFIDNPFGEGFAGAVNTTNGGPVTWTSTSVSNALLAIAFKETGGTPPALQTWYIRSDGGTRFSSDVPTGRCNGLADAADPGSGVNQACAYNDYRYLYFKSLSSNLAYVIVGGDTVIVRNGPWRVGHTGPTGSAGDNFGGISGDPFGSTNPTIPAGTSGAHTKILGENWATCGANNKTQVFGGFALNWTLNLSGTQYVDVRCLELTDHNQCIRAGSPIFPSACSTSVPYDDFANGGILTDTGTSNILLQDLNVHGFVFRGIDGPIGGPVTATNVRVAYNAFAGWDFDDGVSTQSVNGVVTATNLTVEWNGCSEEYPIVHTNSAISCYDDGSGGYGDGVATPNTPLTFTCNQCTFRYNTQDGLDLLHVATSGSNSIDVERSFSYGNMGQQFKTGDAPTTTFINNKVITNCRRMAAVIGDVPATFNTNLSDFCRAAGAGLALNLINNSTMVLQDNTVVGYSATMWEPGCSGSFPGCTGYVVKFQNNISLGFSNPAYNGGVTPGFIFWGADTPNYGPRDHNVMFNVRNVSCPTGFTAEVCTDPLFVSEPNLTMAAESDLDNFNFHLTSGSPAKGAGVAIGGITTDYNGFARPNPPSIGALEFQTGILYTVKAAGGGDFTTISACAAVAVAGDTCTTYVGTYNENPLPANSGSAGLPITFNVHTGDCVSVHGFRLASLSYITLGNPPGSNCTVSGNSFPGFELNTTAVTFASANNLIIKGNYVHDTSNTCIRGPSTIGQGTSSFIYILNNILTFCFSAGNVGSGGGINSEGNNWLIDGNTFSHVADGVYLYGDRMVVRNNHFGPVTAAEEGANHPDAIESSCSIGQDVALTHMMFEHNVVQDWRSSNGHGLLLRDTQSCGQNQNVIRLNQLITLGSNFIANDVNSTKELIYNNSVNAMMSDFSPKDFSDLVFTNGDTGANVINNSLSDDWRTGSSDFCLFLDASSLSGFIENHNACFLTGWAGSWQQPNVSHSYDGTDIFNSDPLYTNSTSNLQPLAGSPLFNAGGPLTTTVGTGASSTALTVVNASFFQDGYSLTGVQADWIRIGASTTVQISSINYSTNVITLASAVSWSNADSVYLYKDSNGTIDLNSANPSIGAFPLNGAPPSGGGTTIPLGVRITGVKVQ